VLPHQVRAEPGQGGAHLVRVLLVHAEDDRLGEGVRLAEEFGQAAGDGVGAGLQRDDLLEVVRVVLLVGDLAAVAVEIALARAPAGRVPLGDDAVDAVRGEEAVVDALAPNVVGPLTGAAAALAAGDDDPAVGERDLLAEAMRVCISAGGLQLRYDVSTTRIRFVRHHTARWRTIYSIGIAARSIPLAVPQIPAGAAPVSCRQAASLPKEERRTKKPYARRTSAPLPFGSPLVWQGASNSMSSRTVLAGGDDRAELPPGSRFHENVRLGPSRSTRLIPCNQREPVLSGPLVCVSGMWLGQGRAVTEIPEQGGDPAVDSS
jgi:hypothetical protein